MIKQRGMKQSILWVLVLALLAALTACGGDSSSAPTPAPVVAVSIAPGSAAVSVGASQQFSATVTGSSNKAVTWTVVESNGGSIDAAGNYTAPMKSGGFHVQATSQADSSKSASVDVNVTAPAPVFNAAAPTQATEGTQYSYAVSATDPAGTPVTLTLASAPDGAALSGGTVTWTPTWGQSRKPNNFVLTATSDAGGTSTQEWTLSPDGTVYGHYFLHFWGSGSDVVVPERDFSVPPISRDPGVLLVWAPQADGSLKPITGVGYADGTFKFPGVPAGNYILSLNGHADQVQGIWENTSTFYWDADENGYIPLDPSQWWPEALVINTAGLDPFVLATDQFSLYDRDGYWDFTSWLPDGGTTLTYATPYLLENAPSRTDRWVAADIVGVPGTDPFTSHMTGPAWVKRFSDIDDGTTVNFSAELLRTNPQNFDLNVAFSSFANAFASSGPGVSTPYIFEALVTSEVKLQNSSLSDPSIGQDTPILADAAIYGPTVPGDPDPWPKDGKGNDIWPDDKSYGTLNYNNPFGDTEKTVYIVDARANFSIPFPGSTDPLPWAVDMSYATTAAPTGPIAPLISPPANANADGVDLLAGGTIASATPTLQWDVPAVRPNEATDVVTYDLFICEPQSGGGKGGKGGGVSCVLSLYVNNVTTNSFVVPAGILQAGHSYIFTITAVSVRDYDAINQQRFSYPVATSQLASAAITVAGSTKTPTRRRANSTAHLLVGVNSAEHRSIVPDVRGRGHSPLLPPRTDYAPMRIETEDRSNSMRR
jgi:hypothetical protein